MLFGCPSSPCFARSFPPRGSHEVADNFCRRKFCEQNFMQARGGTKWLTIFAEKMKFTEFFSGKGKACKDLYRLLTQTLSPKGKARIRQRMLATFPKGESKKEYRHNGTGEACLRGSQERGLVMKRFRRKNRRRGSSSFSAGGAPVRLRWG